jgi:hypothetical protein
MWLRSSQGQYLSQGSGSVCLKKGTLYRPHDTNDIDVSCILCSPSP